MKQTLVFLVILSFVFLSVISPSLASGGKLKSFEKELDKPAETKKSSTPSSTTSQTEDTTTTTLDATQIATQSILEMLMSFFLMGLMQTGMEGFSGLHKELKSEWSPALPTIRVEPSYQYVAGGLNAFSGKLEAGFLIFGVDGEYSRYFEKAPKDSLDIGSAHFMLRSLFTRHFGTNLALGAKMVRGGQTRTAFEFGMPFYIFINKHLIFDILPYVATFKGKSIYDIGAGFSVKWKFIGARAAYRAIFVGDEKLHGPRVGVFFQW